MACGGRKTTCKGKGGSVSFWTWSLPPRKENYKSRKNIWHFQVYKRHCFGYYKPGLAMNDTSLFSRYPCIYICVCVGWERGSNKSVTVSSGTGRFSFLFVGGKSQHKGHTSEWSSFRSQQQLWDSLIEDWGSCNQKSSLLFLEERKISSKLWYEKAMCSPDLTGELQPLLNPAVGGLPFALMSLVSRVVDDGNSWKINYSQYSGRETQRKGTECSAESSPWVQSASRSHGAGGMSPGVKPWGGKWETWVLPGVLQVPSGSLSATSHRFLSVWPQAGHTCLPGRACPLGARGYPETLS